MTGGGVEFTWFEAGRKRRGERRGGKQEGGEGLNQNEQVPAGRGEKREEETGGWGEKSNENSLKTPAGREEEKWLHTPDVC